MSEEPQEDGLLFSMKGIEKEPEEKDSRGSACHTGIIAEMRFGLKAAEEGFSVFFPMGHSHKADVIVWQPPAPPLTIQVKKAVYQWRTGTFKFPLCTINPRTGNANLYGKGDFDFIAAYIEDRKTFAFYPIEELCGKTSHHWGVGHREDNWDDLKTEARLAHELENTEDKD